MLILDTKLKGEGWQFRVLDEAIRTAQFIRNKAIRFWMDNKGVGKYEYPYRGLGNKQRISRG